MTATAYLGVDPGTHGAIALYAPDLDFAAVEDMGTPNTKGVSAKFVADLIRNIKTSAGPVTIEAWVENVGSLPRQAGAFNFGLYTGIVHGALAALGIPFRLVAPIRWKQTLGLRGHDKNMSRKLAAQLFPQLADQLERVKDDGRAEALLIAWYGAHKGDPV